MKAGQSLKFFKVARVASCEDGFALHLDGKPVRTPKGVPLVLPAQALAEALAEEWNALGEEIDPTALPLTRLANTVIDGVRANRHAVLDDLRRYAGSDLLCYRAETPAALRAREAAAWDPLIAWAEAQLAAPLIVIAGIMHASQPPEAIEALVQAAHILDDFSLTGVHVATALTGSIVLGLALARGRLDAAAVWAAATVDEVFQAELWGIDAEAKARLDRQARELYDAARFISLMRT